MQEEEQLYMQKLDEISKKINCSFEFLTKPKMKQCGLDQMVFYMTKIDGRAE